jgi:hypothetical protein
VEWDGEPGPDPDDALTILVDAFPDDDPTGEHRAYHGRRRLHGSGWRTRRLAGLAIVVGVLLVGTGALAGALSPEPQTLAPPPAPQPSEPTGPPVTGSQRLGLAPTAAPGPVPGGSAPGSPAPSSPPRPSPPRVTLAYEAEGAELTGGAKVVSRSGASGGAVVQLAGGQVQFTEVTVAGAGSYELTIHYARPVTYHPSWSMAAELTVNGGAKVTVPLPKLGGSGQFGSARVTVKLDPGTNRIRLSAVNPDRAPDLDRIVVSN